MLTPEEPGNNKVIHANFSIRNPLNPEDRAAIEQIRKSYKKNNLALFISNAVETCLGKPLNGCSHALDILMKKVGSGASILLGKISRNSENKKNTTGVSWTESISDFLARLQGK